MTIEDMDACRHRAVVVIPRVRVQNVNAISSPLTWGFPSITAFAGTMTALQRRMGVNAGIELDGIGVVCHAFEAQVSQGGFEKRFHLTRNPIRSNGETAPIIEEARAHLTVTLVFSARLASRVYDEDQREALGMRIQTEIQSMRIAGGSVLPGRGTQTLRDARPVVRLVPDENMSDDGDSGFFRRLASTWLPGFALVSRDDLLPNVMEVPLGDPATPTIDAWLDCARLTSRAEKSDAEDLASGASVVRWASSRKAGWLVPIPVGYASLGQLHLAGSVSGARDAETPFRFVESIWSIGQWVSPHRLRSLDELVWEYDDGVDDTNPSAPAEYRCFNRYAQLRSLYR